MKVIKVAAVIACSFLVTLCTLIFLIENPEKKRFEQTVESLMIHEGLSSEQEVFDAFPALKDIQSKMDRIAHLNRDIQSLTGGPAPYVTPEKRLQIQDFILEIQQLKNNVNEGLPQFINIYVSGQP